MIKFVIWGLGYHGKVLYEILGEEKVVAYIDSNPELIGSGYKRASVTSFEEYKKRYGEFPIIVSPIYCMEEIENVLLSHNINNYFLYGKEKDVIREFFLLINREEFLEKYIKEKEVYIYGYTLFGMLLYDYLCRVFSNCYFIADLSFDLNAKGGVLFLTKEIEANKLQGFCGSIEILYEAKRYEELHYQKALELFKNKHKNERCFIIGTGPSLRIEDLEWLKEKNEVCISSNGIFKAFEKTKWRPNYYIVSDTRAVAQWKDEILNMKCDRFVADSAFFFENNIENLYKWHSMEEWDENGYPLYSEDFASGSYNGRTVTYDGALQLATYMGFQEIYLLGVDFYASDNKKSQHFIDGYQSKGFENPPIYKDMQLKAYMSAKKYADEHGIKIYNATRGGALEVFERVNFEDLFHE